MESDAEPLAGAELAQRAGVKPDEVDRMVDLGILVRRPGERPFADSDIPKVSLAKACEEAGLPLEAIATAIESGQLSFAFLEGMSYRRWARRSDRTYQEVAAEAGVELVTLRALLEAIGFAAAEPEDGVREDELEVVPLLQFALTSGLMDEATLARVARVYADSLRRISRAETEVYHSRLEMPMLASGINQSQIMHMASQIGEGFPPLMDRALMASYRRQQQLAWMEDMVEHVEAALEEAGVHPRPGRTPAMCFLDLAGYTRLTEEQGDEAAAELASSLDVLVQRAAREEGGLPVKWLGDGVMLHFREPAGAVVASLRMVQEIPKAGLPPAHVGVAAGPVVAQGGDYFGRTVNTASRISARAGAGQVLVNQAVVESGAPLEVRFEELGDVELKGMAHPVRVYEALPR